MLKGVAQPFRWIPALVWMGVIFYWSSQSSIPTSSWLISKLAHLFEYAVLACLVAFALYDRGRWALWTWVVATLYAASDELHQSLTPGRHPMATDVLIDSFAGALTLACLTVFRSWIRSHRKVGSESRPL